MTEIREKDEKYFVFFCINEFFNDIKVCLRNLFKGD